MNSSYDARRDPDLPVSLATYRPRGRTPELGGLVALYAQRHAALEPVRRAEASDQVWKTPTRGGTIGRGSPEHAAALGRPIPAIADDGDEPYPASGSGMRLASLKRALGAQKSAIRSRRMR